MSNNINPGNPQQQRDFNDAINDYRSLLKEISKELGTHRSHVADANAEYKKLDSLARQLQSTEEGINGLSSEHLSKLKEKAQYSLTEISNKAKQLLAQKGLNGLTDQALQSRVQSMNLSEQELALIQAHIDGYKAETEFLDMIESKTLKRIEYEEKIKSLTGATGGLIDSMKGSMDALGLSSMSNFLNVDAARKAMEEEADAIARGEKAGGALEVRMAGIKTLAKGFYDKMFSAEAVIGFIVKQLAKGSQNMADFQKQTGMSYWSAYSMNMEMNALAAGTGDAFINSERLNKSYSMLTTQLGVSADILGGKALISAANLEQRLGMSAENAAQLTTYTRLQGKDTEAILDNTVATVGAFNKQNKTAINAKQVMEDVAGASKATYLNMGKNVQAMAAAATKARALGLSLGQVEKISESMLNFEESIGNELQANLLLGGGVNLAKAREAALTGDMAKLTEEIGKQEGIKNAFATKNVIAQKAAADALGISKEELAQMTLQQDLNNLSAEEFKERYGETTYEAMKSRSASEALGDAMEKIKTVLGGIIQVFTPLLDGFAYLVNIPFVPQILAAVIAVKMLAGGFGKVKDAIGGSFKAMGGLKDKIMGGAADKTKSLAGDAGGADGKKGEGAKGFLTGLADGLKAFGKDAGKILIGAAVLGGVFLILGASMKGAMMIIGNTDPVKMMAFSASVTMLGLTLALLGKIGGGVMQGGYALGVAALSLIPAAIAFRLLGDTDPAQMMAFAGSVTLLGLTLALLGKIGGSVMTGALAMAVLGGAIVVAALGFMMLANVDTGKIIAFSIAVPLLALAAAGLGFLAGPIAAGSLALAALGVGLMAVGAGFMVLTAAEAGFGLFNQLLGIMAEKGISAGAGLAATGIGMGLLGVAGIYAFPGMLMAAVAMSAMIVPLTLLSAVASAGVLPILATTLMQIAAAAPGLLGVGMALFGIAAGLSAVAFAGITAIPAIGGAVMLAAVSPALISLAEAFGMGGSASEAKGKAEEGSLAAVEAKLTELIAVVKAGGDVYLDTNKVGRAQVLGSYKSS